MLRRMEFSSIPHFVDVDSELSIVEYAACARLHLHADCPAGKSGHKHKKGLPALWIGLPEVHQQLTKGDKYSEDDDNYHNGLLVPFDLDCFTGKELPCIPRQIKLYYHHYLEYIIKLRFQKRYICI